MQRYNPLPCLLKTVPSVSGRFLTLLFKKYVVKVWLWSKKNNNKYGLLNKREVKVAGYCLFCVLIDPNGVVVHKQSKKQRTRISTHHDRTSLVNTERVIWYKEQIFACRTQHKIPSRQDNAILPNRVANHSVGFGSCYPLSELGI